MKAINEKAAKVLAVLTRRGAMKIGETRKVDNAPGAFMAVHVTRRSENVYTVAHYFEQNGDRVADPEVDFYVREHNTAGRSDMWGGSLSAYPIAVWHSIGNRQVVAELNAAGTTFERANLRAQRDLATFCGVWFRNVKEQQGI